ncbi:MAG: phenylalanine--tRNA ligase subunit alpha [Candidatus Heimdallarchaeaceae archaeon]
MNSLEESISLPPEVIKIYKIISEKKSIQIKELETITGFPRGKLEYLISFLLEYKLISRQEKKDTYGVLTEAGLDAAKNQLVERRIYSIVKEKKELTFNELSELVDFDKKEMNAGVGVLKKFNVIDIEKGKIKIKDTEKDINAEYQKILEDILNDKKVKTDANVKTLVQRKLVELKEEKTTILTALIPYENIKNQIKETTETSRLTSEALRNGSWRNIKLKAYNLNVAPPTFYVGRKQPYARFIDSVKQKLVALGFQEMRGPIVELEFWNFDALFQAQDHPAREWSDVYRVSNPKKGYLPKKEYVSLVQKVHENGYDTGSKGWGYKWDSEKSARLVLRAQGTSVSARTLADLDVPSKYFSISRCYRPDTVDATHLSEFNQVEGIVADPTITFRDLLGILETFALDVAGVEECTFKPDYYPFTEPSVELSVVDPNLVRIEFGGAGIFRPEVTRPFGIDVPVIAWGLGIDRLFMVKHGITDIRELFSHKLEWLRSAKMS